MFLLTCPVTSRAALRHFAFLVAAIFVAAALAPLALADGPYTIGSANTVTADPNITRPSTTPCVVTLFSDYTFDNNYNLNPFSYTPPADCPGPWAKVILEVDTSVTAGIQYDRTANIWLAGTNIFFGTTAEPGSNLAPSWHTESDLTDYSPLFTIAQSGTIYLGNTVNSTFTGIQSVTATLELYPVAKGQTAPVTANVVLPLSAGSSGGTATLNTGTDTLAATFTLPTNIQNAYLDIYSQGQIDDEFWYTCVPNDVATELESCTNTAFRETEITIDNQPAGVAPVFPWIFTGGIDPYLWFPIPGVQTLNFFPYRVDLTPFAALLNNGQPHTVSLSVYNADSWFSDTATLLLYLDSGSTSVTGALTKNTLTAAPNPVVTENLNVGATSITGTVKVSSARNYVIAGYVNTSHGKITTTISHAINFVNNQSFTINNNEYVQNINQTSNADSTTTIGMPGQPNTVKSKNFQFPLTLDISEVVLANGNVNQTTKVWQTYDEQQTTKQGSVISYTSLLTNAANHQDTLEFDSSFNLLGNENQSASQLYNNTDTTGVNLYCTIAAANNVLTAFAPTCSQ